MKKIIISFVILLFGEAFARDVVPVENISRRTDIASQDQLVRQGISERPELYSPEYFKKLQEQADAKKGFVDRVREGVKSVVEKVRGRFSKPSQKEQGLEDVYDPNGPALTRLSMRDSDERDDQEFQRNQRVVDQPVQPVVDATQAQLSTPMQGESAQVEPATPAELTEQDSFNSNQPQPQEFEPNKVAQEGQQAVQVAAPASVLRSDANADLLASIRNKPQLRKVNIEQAQRAPEVKNSQVQGLIHRKELFERSELARLEKAAQEDPDEFEDQERLDELRAKYGSGLTPQSRVEVSEPAREVEPASVVAEQPQKSVVVTRSVVPVSVPVEIKPATARIEQPVEAKQEEKAPEQANDIVAPQVTWASIAGENSMQDTLENNGASISYQNISGNRVLNTRQQQAIVLKARSLQPGDEVVVDKEGLVTTKNELLERAQQEVNRVAAQQRVQMLEAQSKARIANIKGTLTAQIQAGAIHDARALRKAVEGSLGVGSREANALYGELYKENKERFMSAQAPVVTAKQESKEELLAQVQSYVDNPASLTGRKYMTLSDAAKKVFVTEYIKKYGTDAASRDKLSELPAAQTAFDEQVADMQKAAAPRKTLSAESKAAASQALAQAAAKKALASSAPVAKKEVVQTNGLDAGVVEGLKNQLEKNPDLTREQALDYVDRIGYGRDTRYLDGIHFKGELDEVLINRFKNRPADKTPESLAKFLKMNGVAAEDLSEYQKAVFGDVVPEETKVESPAQEGSTQPVLNPDVITQLKTMTKIKQRGFLTSQGIMGEAQDPYLQAAAA